MPRVFAAPGDAEVEPGIVDGEHEVDLAPDPGGRSAASPSFQEEREVAENLDETHDGQLIQAGQKLHTLRRHAVSAQAPGEWPEGHRSRRARATWAPWRSPEASPASIRMTGRPDMPCSRSETEAQVPDDEDDQRQGGRPEGPGGPPLLGVDPLPLPFTPDSNERHGIGSFPRWKE